MKELTALLQSNAHCQNYRHPAGCAVSNLIGPHHLSNALQYQLVHHIGVYASADWRTTKDQAQAILHPAGRYSTDGQGIGFFDAPQL